MQVVAIKRSFIALALLACAGMAQATPPPAFDASRFDRRTQAETTRAQTHAITQRCQLIATAFSPEATQAQREQVRETVEEIGEILRRNPNAQGYAAWHQASNAALRLLAATFDVIAERPVDLRALHQAVTQQCSAPAHEAVCSFSLRQLQSAPPQPQFTPTYLLWLEPHRNIQLRRHASERLLSGGIEKRSDVQAFASKALFDEDEQVQRFAVETLMDWFVPGGPEREESTNRELAHWRQFVNDGRVMTEPRACPMTMVINGNHAVIPCPPSGVRLP